MAACGGLEHIFEKPLPESPILLESLSPWKHIKSMKTVDDYSFTEIFGALYFKENHAHDPPDSPSSSSPFTLSSPSSSFSSNSVLSADANPPVSAIDIPKSEENGGPSIHQEKNGNSFYRRSDSFSSTKSQCTEGLGSESSDDVEDLMKNHNYNNDWQTQEERTTSCTRTEYENHHWGEYKRSRRSIGAFPPPISCIGRNGKPWVCFKSFRQDGRFILQEIRIPTHEFLHACRENGRLKMQFIQSDDEVLEDDEEEEDEEDVEENNEEKRM